ncbi:helix-turn-helix domain-containing protein [Tenacibaculum ovolyticum]|uniref:helix-turn-helix domain-containing protein n=1 Tax=Tenacibaculum ovolyticum TaxID=104270 RepID=UPI001F3A3036|nr:helix-turn-helix domain-containing protein [Tenacibaculum ovolyticum]
MINFINISDRIQYIINTQHNGTRARFAKSIGFSAQVIANIVSGRKTKPSFDVLNAILSTNDDINAYWLLTGKGEILKSTSSSTKNTVDYKEKCIELLEENRKLAADNIALQKKAFYLQLESLNSDDTDIAKPDTAITYPKKKKTE